LKPQHKASVTRVAEVMAVALVRLRKMSLPCEVPQVVIHRSVMTPLVVYNGTTHKLFLREDWLDKDPSLAEVRDPVLDAMATLGLVLDHKKRLDRHRTAAVPSKVQVPQLAGYKSAKWRYFHNLLVKSC